MIICILLASELINIWEKFYEYRYIVKLQKVEMIEMESLMKYQSVFGQMYTQKQEDYYFIEQFFNDHICTWTLYTLAFGMFINICYCSYRLLLDYFLDWEPINGTTSNDILRAKQRRLVLVNTLSM